jgi:hypothetical protein
VVKQKLTPYLEHIDDDTQTMTPAKKINDISIIYDILHDLYMKLTILIDRITIHDLKRLTQNQVMDVEVHYTT